MDKELLKKVGNIILNVVICVFLAVAVLSVFLTVFAPKDTDGTAELFGYQLRLVTSNSMAECEYTDVSEYEIKDIPLSSMVFVKMMPLEQEKANDWYRTLKVGDVLTFRYVYSTQVTITHRIISITENDAGGFVIELAGDNTASADGPLYQTIDTSIPNNTNYVIGQVTGQSYLLGLVLSFLMKPLCIALIIILPCFLIILLEVVKIMRMFAVDRRNREVEKSAATEKELAELRRKLAELEAVGGSGAEKKEDNV